MTPDSVCWWCGATTNLSFFADPMNHSAITVCQPCRKFNGARIRERLREQNPRPAEPEPDSTDQGKLF